jgi:DNA polymerase-4
MYKPYRPGDAQLSQILCQLSEKTARRLRKNGYAAGGIHVSCLYNDYSYWHHGQKLGQSLYAGDDLYREAMRVLKAAPDKPVRILAVSCFGLVGSDVNQLEFFTDDTKKKSLVLALDAISDRWGEFSVMPGRMLVMERKILDRIAFGGVKGLEEAVFTEPISRSSEDDMFGYN